MLKKSPFLLLFLILLAPTGSPACQLPVFRYALERWASSPFKVTIFRRGELTTEQKTALDSLPLKGYKVPPYLNVIARQVDLSGSPDPQALRLWQSQGSPELPWVVVQFPSADRVPVPAWSGKLTLENATLLTDSPARREVARRILRGDSAVWVLVESGDPKAAQATSKIVETELKKLENTLKLPDQAPVNSSSEPAPVSTLPLKIRFSVLQVRADDPAEKAFLEMLRPSSRGKTPANESVVAYPVFGRGRCLGGHAGNDLTPEAILRECSFLVGACSCVVKSMNPGVDLLMTVNWEDLISGKLAVDEELPPLTGLMPVAAVAGGTTTQSVQLPVGKVNGNLKRNVIASLGSGVILVLGCAIFIWRKRK